MKEPVRQAVMLRPPARDGRLVEDLAQAGGERSGMQAPAGVALGEVADRGPPGNSDTGNTLVEHNADSTVVGSEPRAGPARKSRWMPVPPRARRVTDGRYQRVS